MVQTHREACPSSRKLHPHSTPNLKIDIGAAFCTLAFCLEGIKPSKFHLSILWPPLSLWKHPTPNSSDVCQLQVQALVSLETSCLLWSCLIFKNSCNFIMKKLLLVMAFSLVFSAHSSNFLEQAGRFRLRMCPCFFAPVLGRDVEKTFWIWKIYIQKGESETVKLNNFMLQWAFNQILASI